MAFLLKKKFGNRTAKPAPLCEHQQGQGFQTGADFEVLHNGAGERLLDESKIPPASDLPAADSTSLAQKCEECAAEKKRERVYRWKIIGGLVLPAMLAFLDLTIVATALPTIAIYFDKLNQLNWIVTAFTLTSTSFMPAFGQLADVFGRYVVLQSAMALAIIGSAIGAGAQNFAMVLLGRGIQGLAAAGIMNIIKIALADNVNLKQNSTNTTIFSLLSGLAYSIGPVAGGYLTAVSWRWCFIINIPVAVIAMLSMYILLRHELVGPSKPPPGTNPNLFSRLAILDYGGLVLFFFGTGLIILATTWGGATYGWSSSQVLAPLCIGVVFFIAFFFYEYLLEPGNLMARIFPSARPMIPFSLFYKKDVALVAYINFAAGAAMYCCFYFIGIYWTLVQGYDPGQSGVQLLYYIPGLGAGVWFAIYMCNVWPKQTFLPLMLGSFIEALGVGLIIYAISAGNVGLVRGMMGLAGAGTGFRFMPVTLHIMGIWPSKIAPAMSLIDFSMPFGGTVAIAMMGAVFSNKLAGVAPGFSLSSSSGSGDGGPSLTGLSPGAVNFLHDAERDAVIWAFVSVMPIFGLAVVASLFLGNVHITGKHKLTNEGHLDTAEDVVEEPFLLYLARKRRPKSADAS